MTSLSSSPSPLLSSHFIGSLTSLHFLCRHIVIFSIGNKIFLYSLHLTHLPLPSCCLLKEIKSFPSASSPSSSPLLLCDLSVFQSSALPLTDVIPLELSSLSSSISCYKHEQSTSLSPSPFLLFAYSLRSLCVISLDFSSLSMKLLFSFPQFPSPIYNLIPLGWKEDKDEQKNLTLAVGLASNDVHVIQYPIRISGHSALPSSTLPYSSLSDPFKNISIFEGEERRTLYCMSLYFDENKKMIFVFSGTAFGKIIIWKFPLTALSSESSHSSHPLPILCRTIQTLSAHDGAIFHIRMTSFPSMSFTSVSDDRSLRLWKQSDEGSENDSEWKIERIWYGHERRLWRGGALSPSIYYSSSEDSTVRIWSVDHDDPIDTLSLGITGSVWRVGISPLGDDEEILIGMGGGDGSIKIVGTEKYLQKKKNLNPTDNSMSISSPLSSSSSSSSPSFVIPNDFPHSVRQFCFSPPSSPSPVLFAVSDHNILYCPIPSLSSPSPSFTLVSTLPWTSSINGISISPSSLTIAVGSLRGELAFLSRCNSSSHEWNSHPIILPPDQSSLKSGCCHMKFYSCPRSQNHHVDGHVNGNGDGVLLVVGDAMGEVRIFRIFNEGINESPSLIASFRLAIKARVSASLVFHYHHDTMGHIVVCVVGDNKGNIYIFSLRSLSTTTPSSLSSSPLLFSLLRVYSESRVLGSHEGQEILSLLLPPSFSSSSIISSLPPFFSVSKGNQIIQYQFHSSPLAVSANDITWEAWRSKHNEDQQAKLGDRYHHGESKNNDKSEILFYVGVKKIVRSISQIHHVIFPSSSSSLSSSDIFPIIAIGFSQNHCMVVDLRGPYTLCQWDCGGCNRPLAFSDEMGMIAWGKSGKREEGNGSGKGKGKTKGKGKENDDEKDEAMGSMYGSVYMVNFTIDVSGKTNVDNSNSSKSLSPSPSSSPVFFTIGSPYHSRPTTSICILPVYNSLASPLYFFTVSEDCFLVLHRYNFSSSSSPSSLSTVSRLNDHPDAIRSVSLLHYQNDTPDQKNTKEFFVYTVGGKNYIGVTRIQIHQNDNDKEGNDINIEISTEGGIGGTSILFDATQYSALSPYHQFDYSSSSSLSEYLDVRLLSSTSFSLPSHPSYHALVVADSLCRILFYCFSIQTRTFHLLHTDCKRHHYPVFSLSSTVVQDKYFVFSGGNDGVIAFHEVSAMYHRFIQQEERGEGRDGGQTLRTLTYSKKVMEERREGREGGVYVGKRKERKERKEKEEKGKGEGVGDNEEKQNHSREEMNSPSPSLALTLPPPFFHQRVHHNAIHSLCSSYFPDTESLIVISGGDDQNINIYTVDAKKETSTASVQWVQVVNAHWSSIKALSISGYYVFSSSYDQRVTTWKIHQQYVHSPYHLQPVGKSNLTQVSDVGCIGANEQWVIAGGLGLEIFRREREGKKESNSN